MNIVMKALLEITLVSSIMMILVMIIKAIWSEKVNKNIVAFLWLLVLMRLIIPVTIESPLHFDSLLPEVVEDAETEQPVINENSNTTVNSNDELVGFTQPVNYEYESPINTLETPVTTTKITLAQKVTKYIKGLSLWTWAFIVWIMGCIYILVKSIYLGIRFNKKVSITAYTKNQDLNLLLDEGKACLNIQKEIIIFQSIQVDVPVVFGIIKPKIIIPTRLYLSVSRDKLKLIIMHELCHIKRKDILANIIWLAAKAIHWFNPLVWIAYNLYLEDVELACDDMVVGNVSKKDGFEYSQCLLEVIKLSKKIQRLPMALSFCDNKNKLRKRIVNMLKPKKKLKSAGAVSIFLAVIMIITCFTTACQPTPEGLVVQNKADDDLQEAIEQTATPAPNDSDTDSETQAIQFNEPIAYIEDISSNASNTVTVEINAEVINNQPDNIPVAIIEPYYFSEEDVQQFAKAFFGDTQFYDGIHTKSDFDVRILNLQYRISSDEELLKSDHAIAGGITDLAELRAYYQKTLDRMIEDRENAPDERPALTSFFDASSCAFADLGNGYMGKINAWEEKMSFSAFEDDELYPPARALVGGTAPYTQLDINNTDAEFENAKQMATDMISKMEINAVLGDAYLVDDPIAGTNRQYYVFCFEKVVNDSKLDHTLYSGLLSNSGDGVYEELRGYERLELWIEGDKFVQFKYFLPMQVTEIINENVALDIDYTQAIELAKQHAYVAFVDTYGNYSESKVSVNKIELVLVRTKQANTDNYIVVPAWNFYGDLLVKQKVDDGDFKAGEWRLYNRVSEFNGEYPLVTFNALDGSIIDIPHGY